MNDSVACGQRQIRSCGAVTARNGALRMLAVNKSEKSAGRVILYERDRGCQWASFKPGVSLEARRERKTGRGSLSVRPCAFLG